MIGRSRWFERDEMRSLALSVDVPKESSGEVEEERVMSSVGFGEDHRVDCLSKYERESELSGGVSCGAESSQKSVADCRMTDIRECVTLYQTRRERRGGRLYHTKYSTAHYGSSAVQSEQIIGETRQRSGGATTVQAKATTAKRSESFCQHRR